MKSGHDVTDQLGLHVEVSKSLHYSLLLFVKVIHLMELVLGSEFVAVVKRQVFREPIMEEF